MAAGAGKSPHGSYDRALMVSRRPLCESFAAMNETPNKPAVVQHQVARDEISRRAEELWKQYGCPEGRDEEIWYEAERQLRGTQTPAEALDNAASAQPASVPPAAEQLKGAAAQNPGGVADAQPSTSSRASELMHPPKGAAAPGRKMAKSGKLG